MPIDGERVVVLVDEYDKPILDNLTDPDTARELRDGLRNLYSVIKGSGDAHIRFAFLTGVSKFSKVSLFSGLNNLIDITVDPGYSALCGYTEADLDTVFAPELAGLDRAQIRAWYNGYNWTGEAVYNPFDVLLLFQKRQFRAWWFETATPTFLSRCSPSGASGYRSLGTSRPTRHCSLPSMSAHDRRSPAVADRLPHHADEEELIGGSYFYRLRYPNLEVYQGLNAAVLEAWTPQHRRRRSATSASRSTGCCWPTTLPA